MAERDAGRGAPRAADGDAGTDEDAAPPDREPDAELAVVAEPSVLVEEPEAVPVPRGLPARDAVQRFLDEARRYPRLTDAEERDLIRAVRERGSAAAARKLVVHNLRLVVSIAYQYRQAWTSILDLFQEGSVGLVEAVGRWDPGLGTRFGSYAAYWIRANILRFLMTNARLIHVGNTRAGRKLFFRLERERQKLLAGGFDPTPKLLAAKLGVDERDVVEVSDHLASREVSIERRPDEEGVPLAERIAASGATPEEQASQSELARNVRGLMDAFDRTLDDDRERAVWREHLAASDDPVSLAVLGKRYGVSKQRMGQLADKLKRRFRAEALARIGADIQLAWQRDDGE